MELRQTDTFLFKVLYLAAGGIIVTQVLDLSSLSSMLLVAIFLLTVLLWLRSVRQTLTTADMMVLIIAAVAFINVLINATLTNTSLSFSYIKKVILFVMTLMFLQTAYRMRSDRSMIRFVNGIVDCLTVFLIAMYFLQYSQMHVLNGYVTRYLTFRFSNPNLTGLFLTCMYMLEMYRLFSPEKWYWKLLHIILAIVLVLFIVESQSRNCLLVISLYTLACVWLLFRSRRRLHFTKFWASIVAWFPLIFALGYMLLIYTPWLQEQLAFLVGEGKSLVSRTIVWGDAFEHIWSSPLFGAYSQISDGTGTSQMHNTHLDVAASYGIPVMILVCFLLHKYVYRHGRFYEDKESFVYMLGFVCAIMLGLGEAALFSGGLSLYIFVGTFLFLSSRDLTENGQK